jgi:hypothetical protein
MSKPTSLLASPVYDMYVVTKYSNTISIERSNALENCGSIGVVLVL